MVSNGVLREAKKPVQSRAQPDVEAERLLPHVDEELALLKKRVFMERQELQNGRLDLNDAAECQA